MHPYTGAHSDRHAVLWNGNGAAPTLLIQAQGSTGKLQWLGRHLVSSSPERSGSDLLGPQDGLTVHGREPFPPR